LLRNVGDGRFEDVTASSGLAHDFGACLGAIDGDFNGDGRRDLYVANDGAANQLWINRDGSTFENTALLAGCAFNRDGEAEASMGVDAADFDEDGDEDLFMTHLAKETNTLFRNDGQGWFEDATVELGLGLPSHPATGFGVAWIDVDNDGRLDLIVANGAVTAIDDRVQAGDDYPLDQPNQLFRQTEARGFVDASHRAGTLFELEEVSRAVIVGDVDNDGDPDALITNNNGPVRLALNEIANGNHWLGLVLIGDAVGGHSPSAEVTVVRRDGSVLRRRARVGGSYLAANDPRVLIGLGPDPDFSELRVLWPDGSSDAWDPIDVDRYHTLRQGDGRS
jgi:hypothetical protein